jgi:hypothetical protein
MPWDLPTPKTILTKKFSANKKWAISPLISPPAGTVTATQADKLVCTPSIRLFWCNFNWQIKRKEQILALKTGKAGKTKTASISLLPQLATIFP